LDARSCRPVRSPPLHATAHHAPEQNEQTKKEHLRVDAAQELFNSISSNAAHWKSKCGTRCGWR